MKKVLVPVDGSVRTSLAIDYLVEQAAHGEHFEVIVMNVQSKPRLLRTRGIATRAIFERMRELGEAATANCLAKLAAAGIACQRRVELADIEARAIAECARAEDCDHIVLAGAELSRAAQNMKAAGVWPFRSLVAKVVDRTDLPVTVVRPFSIEEIQRPGATIIGEAHTRQGMPPGRHMPYQIFTQ